MPTYTEYWSPVTDGILSFTNIGVVEVDTGTVLSFVDTAGQPIAIAGSTMGIEWGGFSGLVAGAGSSQVLTFDYDVASLSGSDMITSIDSLYVVDLLLGSSASLVATANVYNLSGDLIASQTYTHGGAPTSAVSFVQAQAGVHVTLTVTMSVAADDTTSSAIDLSVLRQSFGTTNVDQLCSIGDYVWLDLDADGVQGPVVAEPGVSGLTVQLMDSAGTTVLATTTTDSTGFYLFDNLLAGSYSVRFVSVPGFDFTTQDAGTDDNLDSDADTTTGLTGPITLEAGDHVRDVDAGLVSDGSGGGETAGLGDYVWIDADADGVQDGSEVGLAGVTVNLMDAAGTTVLNTMVTGPGGAYSFINLTLGTYQVQFVGPTGYALTLDDQGVDDAVDSDADLVTGLSGPVTLTAGEFNPTIDAGLVLVTAEIGDYVWLDHNADGDQDGTEAGVSGVTVNLLNSAGTVIGTDITDLNGGYLFTGLAAGTYRVEFVLPNSYAFTTANVGANDAIDSDANTGTGLTGLIVLTAGEVNHTVDAGLLYCPPATAAIGNYVWYDCDQDGIQDSGESGLSGVTVQLMNATGNAVLASTVTNSSGYYAFTGLAAGTYQVHFGTKTNYVLTAANQGLDDSRDSDADTVTRLSGPVNLTAGEIDNTVDAGMYYSCAPVCTAKIGNYVWNDCDKDGKQDYNESGISGVTVKLMDATGTTVLQTTSTNTSGYYQFTGLAAGTYQVYFGTKTNYVLTTANQGYDDNLDSDANTTTRLSGPITLSACEVDNSVDAGMYYYCPPAATLGNYVWNDTDRDGLQDSGESGIGGVTVKLMNATGTTVLATTTTSSSGLYQFTGLAAGTYQVHFGTKTGYALSAANQGSNDGIDSDANVSTRLSGPITLTAGEVNNTVDAGMYYDCVPTTATIGNFVWDDCDKDGIQDSGEAGLAGVTVKLMNSTGTTVLATASTNSSGFYQFTGLAAGTYQVYFGTVSGYQLTSANIGSNDAVDSDANTSTRLSGAITLTAGETNNTIDAGFHKNIVDCGPDRYEGLTPGFWSTHLKAWDGAADTKYANLVSSGVLSSVDVLRALPNQGKSGPGGAVGVLLGDSNANGVKDGGETTLFVGLTAAQKIISSSASATDTRQILMRHALAAQLNIYNGKDSAGGLTVGADLISKAVEWLKGDGVFIYGDGSSGDVDRVGSAGVLESGTSGTIDFNTSTAAFTSTVLTSSKEAWWKDKSLGVGSFTADGEEIKNALQAFNEDRLITSADGSLVGWNNGAGGMTGAQTNNATGLWTVLQAQGVI